MNQKWSCWSFKEREVSLQVRFLPGTWSPRHEIISPSAKSPPRILFESTSRWWLTNPGGGGNPDFKWRGWSNGGKSQKPKKSLGVLTNPKSLVTKFNPRALKKAAKQVWLCFVRRTSRPAEALLWVFRLFWTPPKNPFLNQATQKNIC